MMLGLLILVIASSFLTNAFALQLSTDRNVYSEGQPLLVYGQALPNEPLIIRLFAPDGTIAQFNQISADNTGAFSHILIRWPNATSTYSYGTYSVEAIATKEQGTSQTINVKFLANSSLTQVPQQPIVLVSVFAPQNAAINQTFRVFIQVTSDGLLVAGNPSVVLRSSHVHMPDGSVVDLSDSLKTLHQGLFYVDFTPTQEGTYIFHITATSKGTIANGSVATLVLKQDIAGISNQILKLNSVLGSTSKELDRLKSEIQGFGTVLNSSQQSISQANENLNKSVTKMSDSVTNIDQASTQLNSLFLPVVALIAIIIALQITILARRR
ncbi:methyl-accepting chemotaxis protein [Candidatus Nitrosotalea okcheonensis]|uniref:Putative polyhedron envelope protein C-terminal domain-containing protein n=1 Tax=Candidatus Nitrosotalea okcheonensis TaxID=1903276 RepID=A0A2H1FHV0_9ARCH|nr:methyl-accepting chemotaxis protein [Candidatus Nitrosotalea okcheonensis]SMH72338.1 putative polyhedron envelope protein C-terminal domain-containing protein [Candidatus Nitrosotalea okcheonensis]